MRLQLQILTLLGCVAVTSLSAAAQNNDALRANAYATDWSAGMVIEYLKTHDNVWPRSWDDLRKPYETHAALQKYPWSFDELQQRIAVDWSADVGSLMAAASAEAPRAVRVVWLTDGSETHLQGAELNQRILDYLRSVEAATSDADPV